MTINFSNTEKNCMKKIIINLTLVLFALGAMALQMSKAQGSDEVLPPEVKELIGINLPPVRVAGKDLKLDPRVEPLLQPADIPGWKYRGGWLVTQTPTKSMDVEEVYRGNLSIFVVDQIDENDHSKLILDAHELPQNLLWYYVKNGKAVEKKKRGLYEFNAMCKRNNSEVIVALMRPEAGEENCQHETTQVIRAWKIDSETGHITEIAPQGVSCLVPAGDAC
jgi:hypothetical protein